MLGEARLPACRERVARLVEPAPPAAARALHETGMAAVMLGQQRDDGGALAMAAGGEDDPRIAPFHAACPQKLSPTRRQPRATVEV